MLGKIRLRAREFTLAGLLACALFGPAHADGPAAYEIQPGDVLTISVWKETDL